MAELRREGHENEERWGGSPCVARCGTFGAVFVTCRPPHTWEITHNFPHRWGNWGTEAVPWKKPEMCLCRWGRKPPPLQSVLLARASSSPVLPSLLPLQPAWLLAQRGLSWVRKGPGWWLFPFRWLWWGLPSGLGAAAAILCVPSAAAASRLRGQCLEGRSVIIQ